MEISYTVLAKVRGQRGGVTCFFFTLNVFCVVNEPGAAAIAHGFYRKASNERKILFFAISPQGQKH